jgi:hypothetical protein
MSEQATAKLAIRTEKSNPGSANSRLSTYFISHPHPHIALRQDGMREADGFFWNGRDRLAMHGHGLPPLFMDSFVFVSIAYVSSASLCEFANNILVGSYHFAFSVLVYCAHEKFQNCYSCQ